MTAPRAGVVSASALVRAFRAGVDDPISAAERCITAAEATPYCFTAITSPRALNEAMASRKRWRSDSPKSPLDGVPIAWKDMFDVRGATTTMGSEIHRHDAPASEDAVTVASAATAGLVCVGKTNLTEFAFSVLGLNPHFGTPVAPRAGETVRVPGGSSSGSAVAVAVGAACMGIATDTAGSARVPAAFNGLVGYRASSARYPKAGMAPLSPTLDTFGVIAGNVADIALLDHVLVGAGRYGEIEAAPRPDLILDIGFLLDDRVADSVRADVLASIETLRRAGYLIRSRRIGVLHDLSTAIERFGWLGSAEAYALHAGLLAGPDAERMDQRVRNRLLDSADISESDVARLRALRGELMSRSDAELGDSVLLLPTVSHPPPPLDEMEADPERFAAVNLASLRLTAPASFLDLPTVTVPVGTGVDGRWSGLQLSMRGGQDERLLRLAARIDADLEVAAAAGRGEPPEDVVARRGAGQ